MKKLEKVVIDEAMVDRAYEKAATIPQWCVNRGDVRKVLEAALNEFTPMTDGWGRNGPLNEFQRGWLARIYRAMRALEPQPPRLPQREAFTINPMTETLRATTIHPRCAAHGCLCRRALGVTVDPPFVCAKCGSHHVEQERRLGKQRRGAATPAQVFEAFAHAGRTRRKFDDRTTTAERRRNGDRA